MKSHENSTRKAEPQTFQPGVGHHTNFLCGRCAQTRETIGRRIRFVRGLRTYVCAGCAEIGKPAGGASA